MSSRRRFLQHVTMAGTAVAFTGNRLFGFSQSPTNLRKFVQGLPGLGRAGANEYGMYIPVASPDTTSYPGCDAYRLRLGQYSEKVHPDLPKATTLWGYADATNSKTPDFKHLGPVIIAQKDRPVRLTVTNDLPAAHILPVDKDPFFHDAQLYPNKATIHLHGGFVPWISDGNPFSWITPANPGLHGPDWVSVPDMPHPSPGSSTLYYPNAQSSRLLWYHDHAHDLTRLNVYAGLASAYILQDSFEQELIKLGIIPPDEVPLILQDKAFKSGNPKYAKQYPEWEYPIGDLWYPYLYEGPPVAAQTLPPAGTASASGRWANSKTKGVLSTVPSCVPEAFFDTIMVNGAVYPYMNVQKKRYRFRILNAAQARFFNLQLYIRDGSADGITLKPSGVDNNGNPLLVPTNAAGPAMIQIGNECGFIPIPAVLNNPPQPIGFESSTLPTNGNVNRYTLLMSPAERADVIIDFSELPVGTELLLYNDAPAPFPGGDIRNDYYTGNYDLTHIGGAPATKAGFSPNTRTLMEFRVGAAPSMAAAVPDLHTQIAQLTNALPTAPYAGSHPPNVSTAGLPIRRLTLNEGDDDLGRLLQLLGTDVRLRGNNYGRNLSDPPTETPEAGSIEVWKIFNYTADTHPIHLHLVNVAVISRQTFDTTQPPTDKALIGQPRFPDLNELGYKETIRMNPGEVTTLLMKFDLPSTPFTVPLSTRTNVAGYEYVWHCHILEHEEHDMMRPLIVTP